MYVPAWSASLGSPVFRAWVSYSQRRTSYDWQCNHVLSLSIKQLMSYLIHPKSQGDGLVYGCQEQRECKNLYKYIHILEVMIFFFLAGFFFSSFCLAHFCGTEFRIQREVSVPVLLSTN